MSNRCFSLAVLLPAVILLVFSTQAWAVKHSEITKRLHSATEIVALAQKETKEAKKNLIAALEKIEKAIELAGRALIVVEKIQARVDKMLGLSSGGKKKGKGFGKKKGRFDKLRGKFKKRKKKKKRPENPEKPENIK